MKWELVEARLLDTAASDKQLAQHRRRHPRYRTRRVLLGSDKQDIESYVATMSEMRRERIKDGEYETITLEKLIERDKGICHICGKKVAKQERMKAGVKSVLHAAYPTVDHIIPISRGGSHTWENVKLAHLSCNSIKGGSNRIPLDAYPQVIQ